MPSDASNNFDANISIVVTEMAKAIVLNTGIDRVFSEKMTEDMFGEFTTRYLPMRDENVVSAPFVYMGVPYVMRFWLPREMAKEDLAVMAKFAKENPVVDTDWRTAKYFVKNLPIVNL